MNSKTIWNDQVPEKDGVRNPINDVAISPDGTRVIAAVGNRVLLYNAENGDLLDSLRGHKDTVLCCDFSADGTRFASGGLDSVVVIWKSTGQGLLKYNHMGPIQRVVYNPTMLKLASCSDIDVGFWMPDQKQVTKEKVPAKVMSAVWSADGSMLAVGLQNGMISIRNAMLEEIVRMERKAPVMCLLFVTVPGTPGKGSQITGGTPTNASASAASAAAQQPGEVLIVGCWDKTMSFYRIQGNTHKLQSEKQLAYYPNSFALAGANSNKSNYLLVGGSNKKSMLYSRDGMKLFDVATPTKTAWVWAVACHAPSDRAVCGTDNGAIEVTQMTFSAVHSLYRDRYAYRENLTEIIVHHLGGTDRKVRIKCKDLVQRISLYKNKLAAMLTDRVCIYESSSEESADMQFRLRRERISMGDKPCSLMTLTTNALIFCRECLVEMYGFDGNRTRVWVIDSVIKYVKVDGGPENSECLLIGCENGCVYKLFLDNPFPMELTKLKQTVQAFSPAPQAAATTTTASPQGLGLVPHGQQQQQGPISIISADLSLYRDKVALIDSNNVLTVTILATQEVVFTASPVYSVCFNTEVDDMLCYTGETSISVVSALVGSGSTAPGKQRSQPLPQEQHIAGLAIGFQGQKIYCVYRGNIIGVDVPQGGNMLRALDNNDYRGAYGVACLGATEAEWKLLAMRCLRANAISLAKSAFARLKDTKFLSLIENIEKNPHPSAVVAASASSASSSEAVGEKSRGGRVRGGAAAAPVGPTPAGAVMGLGSVTQPLDPVWQAEILATEGHHHEAAKAYARAGKIDESIRLFTDLRRWNDAKLFAQSANQPQLAAGLTAMQAKWLQEVNDWRGASELFVSLGQYMQAAKIVGDTAEPGWADTLIEVVRGTPSEFADVLNYCGDKFAAADEIALAREAYTKSANITQLMSLYASKQMWAEAAKLAEGHEGQFDVSVFLPYAEWLVVNDQYEEAMTAYKKAGRRDLARKVLQELTCNAVTECRFKDAAYYYWLLSRDENTSTTTPTTTNSNSTSNNAAAAADAASQDVAPNVLADWELKADLYFAYATIHSYITDPFTSQQPEMLFQCCRYLINSLGNTELVPAGISKSATLYTLAKQAMILKTYKLARHAYDRLSKLTLPFASRSSSNSLNTNGSAAGGTGNNRRIDDIELDMLIVQAKPMRDDPDNLPVCYRCGSTNPLLNPFTSKFAKADVCTNCGHPFVRSFLNFDVLPLVEFVCERSISDEEAIELIRQPPTGAEGKKFGARAGGGSKSNNANNNNNKGRWKESKDGNAETMSFDGPSGGYGGGSMDEDDDNGGMGMRGMMGMDGGGGGGDLFSACLQRTLSTQGNSYQPVVVDSNALLSMKRQEIFVCKPSSKKKRATFYKNMLPEIAIAISQPCHRFFHLEDFEFAYLSNKSCPYSRLKSVGEYGSL